MTETKVQRLWRGAQEADEAFHSAVVKQFGRKAAGDMRFQSSTHNAETKAAAEFYRRAQAAWKSEADATKYGLEEGE